MFELQHGPLRPSPWLQQDEEAALPPLVFGGKGLHIPVRPLPHAASRGLCSRRGPCLSSCTIAADQCVSWIMLLTLHAQRHRKISCCLDCE